MKDILEAVYMHMRYNVKGMEPIMQSVTKEEYKKIVEAVADDYVSGHPDGPVTLSDLEEEGLISNISYLVFDKIATEKDLLETYMAAYNPLNDSMYITTRESFYNSL